MNDAYTAYTHEAKCFNSCICGMKFYFILIGFASYFSYFSVVNNENHTLPF